MRGDVRNSIGLRRESRAVDAAGVRQVRDVAQPNEHNQNYGF
jgi:hypothetical protein